MSNATLNFNIGVLGHVDSGKTSLAQALSTVASTAAFDKNPQSKERGITLDLGFSSFAVDAPEHLKEKFEKVQYTLVDCPGHASLIRTVIGGAQIIDLMFLVIDAGKGMQTQTAECLILGEITCSTMIVVINKVDVFPIETREKSIEKLTKKMKATLSRTKFKDSPIISVAAKPSAGSADAESPMGLSELIETLKRMTFLPERSDSGSLLFAVDHCFSIRGQGTVMTGTILQGSIAVNDNVEISSLREIRKVKSIQMFKKSVNKAIQGDRVGVCVTQFDSSLLERGLVCTPNTLPMSFATIIKLRKIPYFKGVISTKSKFHISMGHETVLASLTLFGCPEDNNNEDGGSDFRLDREYFFVESLDGSAEEDPLKGKILFALLEFEHPIIIAPKSKVLGSKLDTDIHTNTCRLAFEGPILRHFEDKAYRTKDLPSLKIYKFKEKTGTVERVSNEYELIGKNMFKKESKISLFVGLQVRLSTGEVGQLEGTFGQSGKFKVRFLAPLEPSTMALFNDKKKKPAGATESVTISLKFKRYIFDKSMAQ